MDADEEQLVRKAMERAFRLLSVRSRSRQELRAKLAEKGFGGAVLEKTFDRLAELGYLDDESFAAQWARHLAVHKLYGDNRIRASLAERGIDKESSARALYEAGKELSERERIRLLIGKKSRDRGAVGLDIREKRRIARSLLARGFTVGLIYELLGRTEEEDHEGE